LIAVGGVFDRDVAEVGGGVLGEAAHINISRRIDGHFDGLIGAVGHAIVVVGHPGLLDLRCAVVANC